MAADMPVVKRSSTYQVGGFRAWRTVRRMKITHSQIQEALEQYFAGQDVDVKVYPWRDVFNITVKEREKEE